MVRLKWVGIDQGQGALYTKGVIQGIPTGLLDTTIDLFKLGLSPIETYNAIKDVLSSENALGNISNSVMQEYTARIDKLEKEYEKAGTQGSYNAGLEAGKLYSDLFSYLTGVGAFAKGGVTITSKIAAKFGSKPITKVSNPNLDARAANKNLSYCSGNACFTAGTLIETKDGLKAVEQFSGGELIWSRNENTLEYGYKPVIATQIMENQAIFEVVIENDQGIQETLETTEEHPFWIKGYGWLKASLLQSGMTLLDRKNEELTVVSQYLIPNKFETVYNIEVDGFHTYHVGELGVWVHNANCCDIKSTNVLKVNQINKNGYEFKNGVDLDLKGRNISTKDATNLAFEKVGVSKSEFTVTKWGVDKTGKSFPVEYRVLLGKNRGAEVSIDVGHTSAGTPGAPHIGWQTPGKNNIVGHIFLDDVNVNRSRSK